jgi:hypothetical protein
LFANRIAAQRIQILMARAMIARGNWAILGHFDAQIGRVIPTATGSS